MTNTLLHHIKHGDSKSFHEFYFAEHARLYQYIYKFTGSEWMAEETVQLSFIKLWETRENLSSSYSLSTQLFRIAKSIVIDLLRKQAVRKTVSLSEYSIIHPKTNFDPETKDKLARTLSVIRRMPPVQRKVFSYSRIDNYSHKEIAEKLSISTKTVETHITRAIKHLKKTIPLLLVFFR